MTNAPYFHSALHVAELHEEVETIDMQPIIRTVQKGRPGRPWIRALKDSDEQRILDEAHIGLRNVQIDGAPVRIVQRDVPMRGDWVIYWVEPA